MTSFLATCLEQACLRFTADQRPQRLVLASAVMNKLSRWLLTVEMAPRYLLQEQADHMYNLAFEYLKLALNIHQIFQCFFELFFVALLVNCKYVAPFFVEVPDGQPQFGTADCTSWNCEVANQTKASRFSAKLKLCWKTFETIFDT